MDSNLLLGGIEEVHIIKQKLIELQNLNKKSKASEIKESQLEKSIEKKENDISDKTTQVTRQRREDMEATFDEQISRVNEQLDKVQSQKEKKKKKAISQRIDAETAGYRSKDEELILEGKSVFKKENIPFVYNNRFFFALYYPSGIGDIGIILLSLIIAFFAIPLGVYFILLEGMNVIYLSLCYIAVIIVFGGIYLIVGKTKCKHREALGRVRGMRKKIQESKKQQRRIKRKVRNDKDERSYDLDEFDSEIKNLQNSINEITEQKIIALREFDDLTSQNIKDQIIANHKDELDSLKVEYHKVHEENKENLDQLNKLSLSISEEYEGYLGKDNLSLEKIEKMEEIMTTGDAKTISEALSALSQK